MRRISDYRSRYFFIAISVLIFSTYGCARKTVDVVPTSPIAIASGNTNKSISMGKVASLVSEGQTISYEHIGVQNTQRAKFIFASRYINNFNTHFNSILKRNNYNIIGYSSDLYDNAASTAELHIGMRILNVTCDVYLNTFSFVVLDSGTSVATVDIEWQVYNALDPRTVLKKTHMERPVLALTPIRRTLSSMLLTMLSCNYFPIESFIALPLRGKIPAATHRPPACRSLPPTIAAIPAHRIPVRWPKRKTALWLSNWAPPMVPGSLFPTKGLLSPTAMWCKTPVKSVF